MRRRIAAGLPLTALIALVLGGACVSEKDGVKGAPCDRASDCANGLFCVQGACNDDLSKVDGGRVPDLLDAGAEIPPAVDAPADAPPGDAPPTDTAPPPDAPPTDTTPPPTDTRPPPDTTPPPTDTTPPPTDTTPPADTTPPPTDTAAD